MAEKKIFEETSQIVASQITDVKNLAF